MYGCGFWSIEQTNHRVVIVHKYIYSNGLVNILLP